jgi:hypothetical protein
MFKTGDKAVLGCNGKRYLVDVVLASANGKSLVVSAGGGEEAIWTERGMFLGPMPISLGDDGYRSSDGCPLTLEAVHAA